MKIKLNEEQVNQLNSILNNFPIKELQNVQALNKILADNVIPETEEETEKKDIKK